MWGAGHQRSTGAGARRLLVTVLGVVLVWGALGALGYIGGWQLHAHNGKERLLAAEQRSAAKATKAAKAAKAAKARCVVSAQAGQLAGELRVPVLHLRAPVEQGTGDAQLSVAVGHAPSSVWPGGAGSAVLLAHDVSYFVHLDQLRPGDRVTYTSPCGTTDFIVRRQEVVTQGTPIPNGSGPTLVLDTCYPPNALFFTTKRLLVWATATSSPTSSSATEPRPAPASSSAGHRGRAMAGLSAGQGTAAARYSVPAPPALVAQGLTLANNEVPMGTMALAGDPSVAWEQSPGPMALEAAALEAYFGALHSASQGQSAWWSALAPGVAMPEGLAGATVGRSDAPLDVEIDSAGGVPTQVVLRTTITLSGGAAPGTYDEAVTAAVHGSTVTLGGWTLSPA